MLGLATGITNTSYQWQPNMVGADLKLWLRNSVGITLNGADVSQWDDSSGNANHAAQTTAGDQGLASGGGIDFTSANSDHYDLSSAIDIAVQEAFMGFFVINLESVSSEGLIGQNNNAFIEVNNNKKIKFKTTGTGGANVTAQAASGTPFDTGSKFVLGIKRDSGSTGNVHMYKDGTLITPTSQVASPGSMAIDSIGTKEAANFFDGIMYEVLLYDTVDLTASEITKISNYLKNKHSI